jgi:hypothetical protein
MKKKKLLLKDFILKDYEGDKPLLETKFNQILSNKGLSFSIEEFQEKLEEEILSKSIQFYLSNINIFKLSLFDLNEKLGDDSNLFISTAYDVFYKIKFPKDIFKYFMIEYLVGEEIQDRIFRSFRDILDFLTLLSKGYSTKVQIEIERKAYYFSKGIMDILIHHQNNQSFIYEKFKKQINSDLI